MATKLNNRRWKGRVYYPGGGEDNKTFDRRRDAEAWEREGRSAIRADDLTDKRTKQSFGAFIAIHQDEVLDELSPATRATYKGHLSLRIVPTLGPLDIASIGVLHIERAQRKWRSEGKGLSASAVLGTRNCTSRFFRHAKKLHLISVNPVFEAKRPRSDVERVVPTLTPDEVDTLATRCDLISQTYGDYVRVAAGTGLRAGELTALHVGDVDLQRGILTVSRAWSRNELQTPKSGRVRQVIIFDALVPVLEPLVAAPKSEWLFRGPSGTGRLHHNNFRYRVGWPALVDDLGFSGTHFHDLRASAIVLWIRAGISLATVRVMAGHESLSTTDLYARMARNDFDEARSMLSSYLSRTSSDNLKGGAAR